MTGPDPIPTFTYSITENGTSLSTQISSSIDIDDSGPSPVILIPEINGVIVGTYEFIVEAVSDSDSTIKAQYTLFIEVIDPCQSATVDTSG